MTRSSALLIAGARAGEQQGAALCQDPDTANAGTATKAAPQGAGPGTGPTSGTTGAVPQARARDAGEGSGGGASTGGEVTTGTGASTTGSGR
jgi:hypothetical protein